MTFNMNQFSQSVIKGQRDLSVSFGGKIITGVISQNQATALVPGARVKMDTVAGVPVPQFVAAAAADAAIGVIQNQINKASFTKGDSVDILSLGSVYYAEAAAVIAAGATVEGVLTGSKVQTRSAAAKHGVAIDAASASGDLIRIQVIEPIIGA